MATVEEIEFAVRCLSGDDRMRLVERLKDVLSDAWDLQIERDIAAGCLDHLIAEVEQDIAAGRTVPLDEVINHS